MPLLYIAKVEVLKNITLVNISKNNKLHHSYMHASMLHFHFPTEEHFHEVMKMIRKSSANSQICEGMENYAWYVNMSVSTPQLDLLWLTTKVDKGC